MDFKHGSSLEDCETDESYMANKYKTKKSGGRQLEEVLGAWVRE